MKLPPLPQFLPVIATSLTSAFFGIYVGQNHDDLSTKIKSIFTVQMATPISDTTLPSPVFGPNLAKSGLSDVSRTAQIMKYGFPSYTNLKSFDDFVLSYDTRNRVPFWVFEHLSAERLEYHPSINRKDCNFIEDITVHQFFRASNVDYKGSGYDRGHLAAAGNHRRSQKAMNDTFVLSNMAPQVGKGFNRGKWQELEKYVRKLAKKSKNVYCCTGPLYLPKKDASGKMMVSYEVIGRNNVAVPTHFFKVVVVESNAGFILMDSFVLPNAAISDDASLRHFRVPIDSIERSAGFLIFEKIDRKSVKTVEGNLKLLDL